MTLISELNAWQALHFPHLLAERRQVEKAAKSDEAREKAITKCDGLSTMGKLLLKTAQSEEPGKDRAKFRAQPTLKAAKPAPVATVDVKPARSLFAHLRNAVFEYPPVAAIAAPPALKAGDVTGDTDKWATQRGQIEAAKQALKAGNVLCDADVWAANRRG